MSSKVSLMELRIQEQIDGAIYVEVIAYDMTSVKFKVAFVDCSTEGIFYPWEWNEGGAPFDDFELSAEYVMDDWASS